MGLLIFYGKFGRPSGNNHPSLRDNCFPGVLGATFSALRFYAFTWPTDLCHRRSVIRFDDSQSLEFQDPGAFAQSMYSPLVSSVWLDDYVDVLAVPWFLQGQRVFIGFLCIDFAGL